MWITRLRAALASRTASLIDVVPFLGKKRFLIFLDYKVNPTPRYGYGKPPHPVLYEIINENRGAYKLLLSEFLRYTDQLVQIPLAPGGDEEPSWINGFLPGLDAVALYALMALNNPERYVEIGSGNSTKFARRAIQDHGLRTRIVSVDPFPRAIVDSLCDEVIRKPLEEVGLSLFDDLQAGDIVFVDGSHRTFTNSDATVMFLDVLPRLKEGILVEFHDTFLPCDYPPAGFAQAWYSEQYLLACYLLAGGGCFEVVLPNWFVSEDPELSGVIAPLWSRPQLRGAETNGSSFWIRTNGPGGQT